MGLLDGNKTLLRFTLVMESVNVETVLANSPLSLLNKLNSFRWMGKDPETCMVVNFEQKEPVPLGKTAVMDHAEFLILVGYRPEGWISDLTDAEDQRLNGWHREMLDRRSDGSLLDGHGNDLPAGAAPVWLRFRAYEAIDFNEYDFGHFLGEE